MPNSFRNKNEAAMLQELTKVGLKNSSIQKLHFSKKPLPKEVVKVILKWLPGIYTDHVGSGEHLIMAFVFTGEDFNPKTIIDLYKNQIIMKL